MLGSTRSDIRPPRSARGCDTSSRTAAILLACAVLGLLVTILPGFLVVQGYRSAHRTASWIYRVLLASAVAALLLAITGEDPRLVVFQGIAAVCFGIAVLLVQASGYRLAAAFFRARRVRRAELKRAQERILRG